MSDYNIPSFTVTTSTPIVTAGDDSVKNPYTSNKQTYTSTYNNITATKNNDLRFYAVDDNSDIYTDYYIETNGKIYHSDSTGKTERLDDSQAAKFKNLIKRDDYHGNKYIEIPASKCRGSEYFYTIFKKPEVHFYVRIAPENNTTDPKVLYKNVIFNDYIVWKNRKLIHRFVDGNMQVLDYDEASEFKETFASGTKYKGYKWREIDPVYCRDFDIFTDEAPYKYYIDLHDKDRIYILDTRIDKVYWFSPSTEGTTDCFGDSWFKAENLKNTFYYVEVEPYKVHNFNKLKWLLDKKNKEMRNLTKKEQEKYTENITKVYEPTGYTLDEVAKKSEEVKDGSFDNLLKVISGLKDYIDDKDKLSKAQTDILLAAQAYKATKTKDEFCRSYSLTNEEVDRMNKWIAKHNKKLHPKGLEYQGAIGVSHDEVRMTSTSIGVGIDCVCTDCLKLYEEKKAEVAKLRRACKDDVPTRMRKKDLKKSLKKEEKKLDKLYKQAVFEIRGIDD